MIKLFPYNLFRIAGLGFSIVDSLDSTEWIKPAEDIKNATAELNESRLSICEELLTLIQNNIVQKEQHRLLNIRRDIFNKKAIKPQVISETKALLGDALYIKISHYLNLTNQKIKIEQNWQLKYDEINLRSKKALQKASKNDQLLKGLAFSSIDLLQNIKHYQAKDITDLRKKDIDTETGVLKYITRMACKTSPFSTFTNIALGKNEHTNRPDITSTVIDQKNIVKGHVRVNTYIFGYIKGLLSAYKVFYKQMPLKLNPTIQKGAASYTFLASRDNIEAFQKIDLNAINELILLYLQIAKSCTFNELTIYLAQHVDASKKDIQVYLKKLFDHGLLEFDFPVSGNDPDWDVKLIDFLAIRKNGVPHIAGLIYLLQYLRKTANKLAQASSQERSSLINSAFLKSKNFFSMFSKAIYLSSFTKKALQELITKRLPESQDQEENNKGQITFKDPRPFLFQPRQIFYEDTTLEVLPLIDHTKLSNFADLLNNLITSLNSLEYKKDELREMTIFFKNKYGAHAEVTFLKFYEDYYRDIKRDEDKLLTPEQNNDNQSVIKKLRVDWQNKFINELEESTNINNHNINLTLDLINRVNNGLGLNPKTEKGTSLSCIVQLYSKPSDNQQLYAVLHGAMQGYGKMFSRFLHLLNEDVLNELRAFNINESNADYLHIENTDGSFHNSNLHPPLFEDEVRIPGGHNAVQKDKQHLISDFIVRFNEITQKIELVNKLTNKQTLTYDLGFLGLDGRSKQYQLLSEFSDNNSFNFSCIFNPIHILIREKAGVDHLKNCIIYPRITLEEQIVIKRKQWIVPSSILPFRNLNESNADYFLRINDWRLKLGIPERVFVFVDPERTFIQKKIDKATLKVTRDDYKPQYVSFNNVLLIGLFEKIMKKVPRILKIEEMLPDNDHLTNIHGEKRVTESVIQWYN